jgi:hypothetical protein
VVTGCSAEDATTQGIEAGFRLNQIEKRLAGKS